MHRLQEQVRPPRRSNAGLGGKLIQLAPGLDLPGLALSFGRDQEVFADEEPAGFVYKVIAGAVRDVRILSDGRRQVSAFHLKGDVFGLECGETHTYAAEAVADSEIALVRRSVIERAAETEAGAARKLWWLTSRDLARLQDHMLLLARNTAAERVCAFLLGMARRAGSGRAVDLPMSRTDIADYLGLTIETVSRTLSRMVRDRVISMPRSRHILLGESLAPVGV